MFAGVPIAKSDFLRPLLERADIKLTGSQHLGQYVPKIEAVEFSLLAAEMRGQRVFLVFDGTQRLGEALSVVARWCDKDFKPQQRLVNFSTLAHSPDNKALSTTLTNVWTRQFQMSVEEVTGFGRDSCKVNGSATARLCIIFPNASDILCICHTLNNTGEHLEFPEKRDFMTSWLILVQTHSNAGVLWSKMTEGSLVSFSNIRWWSKQEVENGIAENFSLLLPFLLRLEADGIGDATTKKMLAIYRKDPILLQVSFAAGLDGVLNLLKTTYELEGDRLEILLVFRRVESLRAYGRRLQDDDENRGLLPNVDAVVRRGLEPLVGYKIVKEFAGHGTYLGTITDIDKEDPVKFMYTITYEDGDVETMDLDELRPFLAVHGSELRKYAVKGLSYAYAYLEKRLTGWAACG
ncbi:hypothetical protein CYMTET_32288 [Cymbomonas tetramitiformis]|uniref:PTM/DIR17-like Tudor domain-containing protein n=1 Tax=Cymbomonas tetramitiformis TaxID=36881 RepID=A0AAE0FFQ4_9CHLO|nr:hypothetical protein CYMTET_32288 [Cymbomonas tetramitiformis]